MLVNRKFLTLGVIILLVPFLGIPDSWKYVLIWLLGLVVIFTAISFNSKKRNRRKTDQVRTTDTYAENQFESKKIAVSEDSSESDELITTEEVYR